MRKFNNIFKIILEATLIFLIFFIWMNFYLKSPLFASVFSLIMAGVIEGILQIFRIKKKDKSSMREREKIEAEKMFISLVNDENPLHFFERLFGLRNKEMTKKQNFILLSKHDEKIAVYPFLKYKKLSGDDVLFAIKSISRFLPTKIVIICGESEKQAIELSKSSKIQVVILDKYQTYLSIFKEYEFYPKIENVELPHTSFKNILLSFFSRSHARGFIISALFLMLGSLFTKMNLYYLISTSILLIFGIICLFNKKEKPQDFSI